MVRSRLFTFLLPRAAIKNEISFSPEEFVEIFGSKEIDGRKSYADDDMNEEGICRKVPRVIYPQMAKNQANQWVYVVNEVEYTQAVVAEVCEYVCFDSLCLHGWLRVCVFD